MLCRKASLFEQNLCLPQLVQTFIDLRQPRLHSAQFAHQLRAFFDQFRFLLAHSKFQLALVVSANRCHLNPLTPLWSQRRIRCLFMYMYRRSSRTGCGQFSPVFRTAQHPLNCDDPDAAIR